jgi:hypothetical protein
MGHALGRQLQRLFSQRHYVLRDTIASIVKISHETSPMKELIAMIARHSDSNGHILWPNDTSAQQQLALALYGCELISSFDYWISSMLKLLEGTDSIEMYSKHTLIYKKYMPLKEGLAAINPIHHLSIRQALFDLASGILFSSHVALDQALPGYHIRILVEPSTGNKESAINLKASDDDLHDYVAEWIWNFSKYAEELVERSEDKYGVSYRLK